MTNDDDKEFEKSLKALRGGMNEEEKQHFDKTMEEMREKDEILEGKHPSNIEAIKPSGRNSRWACS